jgi:predicted porin
LTGTEDLGGGLKAEFKIEQGIGTNPRSGIAQNNIMINGTSTGNGFSLDNTVLGDRELWIGATKGGLRVNAGFGVTAMRNLAVQTDAAQSNQMGNPIAHVIGAFRREGVRVDYSSGAWLVSGGASGNRQNSAGVTADATHVGTPAGEFRQGKGYTYGVQYTQGPINAGYFHDEVAAQNEAYASAAATSWGLQVPVSIAGAASNVLTKTDLLAGTYDAGVAKLFAQYHTIKVVKVDGTDATSGAGKKDGTSIGVRVPFGATTVFAQMFSGHDKLNPAANATTDNREWKGQSFGVRHDLSKRTYAYLNTGYYKTDVSSQGSDNTKYQQTALGLVHSF